MANANIRCEECRGMFTATPLPDAKPKPDFDIVPQFTFFGPGWWLTCIVLLLVAAGVILLLGGKWLAMLWCFLTALSVLVFSQIVNYLGYIAKLLEYGFTRKQPK